LSPSRRGIQVEGHQRAPGEDMEYNFTVVGPSYLTTMGIPLVKGRDLTLQDRAGAAKVMIVNEKFAQRFWPGQDPIGKRVMYDGENYATVVGVARDARLLAVGTGDIKAQMFLPALQFGWWGATLHVRMDNLTKDGMTSLAKTMEAEAPRWITRNVHTMSQQVASSIMPQRVASVVLAVFGSLALFLSAIGLYGVIAYAVAQRTHEFGIRMALGASSRDVLQLMLNQGLRVIVGGALLGVVITAFAAKLLESLLLGLSPLDPISFIAAPVMLVSVGIAATLLPARRAAHIDPLKALRAE
jgi:predicted permease